MSTKYELVKTWKIFFLAAGILSAALSGCGGQAGKREEKKPEVLLRFAETMPEDDPSARAEALFAQLVEERSEGRIRINIYYNGEMGMPDKTMEQLRFGGLALTRVSALELTNFPLLYDRLNVLNPAASPAEQMEWIKENEGDLKRLCEAEHMTPLAWYYPEYRCFYGYKDEILDAAALKGKRVQTASCRLMADWLKERGAEAVGYTSMDSYKFFNTGNIDCAESSFGEFIGGKYAQYSHYVTINRQLSFPDVILMNTDCFSALSKEDQELIAVCAQATCEYQKLQMENLCKTWEEELKEHTQVRWEEGDFR